MCRHQLNEWAWKNDEKVRWKYQADHEAMITSYVPRKKFFRKKHCAWVDFRTRKQLKNRYRKWKRYKSTKKTCDFVEYKKARNAAIASLRKAHRKFEKKLACNIKNDSKTFYRYVRSKSRTRILSDHLRTIEEI